MRRWMWLSLLALACSSDDSVSQPTSVALGLEVVASGLSSPLYLTAPANDPRLFIVTQTGQIRIVQNGQLLPTPFLDVASRITSGGERGLLSVAFDPAYATNGFFYVNYTDRNGDTNVERYRVGANPNVADPASAKRILFVDQPFANHNGGHLLFGADGMLYVAMGDGGSAGDPQNNGQNRGSLLGKLLRIDVSRGDPYAIPADNPFANQPGARGEVWAFGLRNQWRIAFDRTDRQLYVADVGQNAIEEINVVAASTAGVNYGWRVMEGGQCYNAANCDRSGMTQPVSTYSHAGGACSVTGGIVYRGQRIPELRGHYFYGDYCAGWVKSFRYANGQVTQSQDRALGSIGSILSFGEDAAGEMYLLSSNGTVYRFVQR